MNRFANLAIASLTTMFLSLSAVASEAPQNVPDQASSGLLIIGSLAAIIVARRRLAKR